MRLKACVTTTRERPHGQAHTGYPTGDNPHGQGYTDMALKGFSVRAAKLPSLVTRAHRDKPMRASPEAGSTNPGNVQAIWERPYGPRIKKQTSFHQTTYNC